MIAARGALRYGTVFIIVPVWRKKGALAAALHVCNMGEGATGCVSAAVGHAVLHKDREPFVGRAALWYHSRVCCLGRKQGIHPQYVECTVTCSCGNTFKTHATVSEMKVELCNECHPFYTGQQKFVDTGGRVQRFADKFGGAAAAQLKKAEEAKAAKAAKAAEAEAARKAAAEAKAAEKAKRAAKFAEEAAKQAAEAPAEAPVEEAAAEAETTEAAE